MRGVSCIGALAGSSNWKSPFTTASTRRRCSALPADGPRLPRTRKTGGITMKTASGPTWKRPPSGWWRRECEVEKISRGFVFSRGNIIQKMSETASPGQVRNHRRGPPGGRQFRPGVCPGPFRRNHHQNARQHGGVGGQLKRMAGKGQESDIVNGSILSGFPALSVKALQLNSNEPRISRSFTRLEWASEISSLSSF